MNKQEKLISVLLALLLAGWLWHSFNENRKLAEARGARLAIERAQAANPNAAASQSSTNALVGADVLGRPQNQLPTTNQSTASKPTLKHQLPEQTVVLSNDQMAVTFTSRGACVARAVLFNYAEKPGALSAENPAVTFAFAGDPAERPLALTGLPGLAADADYTLVSSTSDSVTFAAAGLTRKITLRGDYQLALEESFPENMRAAVAAAKGVHGLSAGAMPLGASKNDLLSVDSLLTSGAKGKPAVEHHGETDPLKSYLVGSSGGCSGKKDASGIPARQVVSVPGARTWLAVKNRFFVTALAATSQTGTGFTAAITREEGRAEYVPHQVAAQAVFPAELPPVRTSTFYIGPKKQELLWDLGMRDVMEFGMWRWVCYPMVCVLNLFNGWIPSYGIAIILLTILVRLIFWPLTHKSTVSMRRMSEIQPKMKELREKFKDNPQRLQQETWALYRDNKVNPMASCLPMLVQIPVFIALFTVLRSAVELRYAPFLWIADLSEPEGLFASWFPFGGLNILPVLMAVTMGLQSALTPSTGDKNQQRMMMVMMPVMMLVMFYSFPSALSLYWTLSQVISIVQMWWIRKRYTPAPLAASADTVDVPSVTRQMRRHGA